MIDLDTMPPDWNFAEDHARANHPGIVDDIHTSNNPNMFCPCCLKPIIKQEIPLCSNSKQLEFLGFGFPLYFIFLKYCLVLILVFIVTYCSMSLYWAILHNQSFCSHRRLLGETTTTTQTTASASEQNYHCTSFLILFSRIEDSLAIDELILRITSFIAHLCTLIYIRDSIRKTIEYYDQKTTSLSDFSILIRNLPLKDGIQQNIRQFIHKYFAKQWKELKSTNNRKEFQQQKKVMQITLLPDLHQYYELLQQKKLLIQEKRSLYIQLEQNQSLQKSNTKVNGSQLAQKINAINKKVQFQNSKIAKKCQQFGILASEDRLQAHQAIVTLNSELFKNTILDQAGSKTFNSRSLKQYFGKFKGKLRIKQAPEPNEIKWQNVNLSSRQRWFGIFLGWGLSLLFIVIITIGFYFLVTLKTQNLVDAIEHSTSVSELHKASHYKIAIFVVYLTLFLIVIFNKFVLGFALHYFTHLERHYSSSEQEFSFAIKYTIGMFFTTAVMTLAVEFITFHNFYSHQYGVIEEQSVMFFINAFFVPLIWLVNPWQIYTLIIRRLKKGKKSVTQRQANHIMSNTSYIMGKRYAEVIETMWFTFLYGTLVPFGAFITFIGLCFYYWIDKINLLRRSSLSHSISGKMAVISLKLLDFTLMLRPIGTLIFDSQIRSRNNPTTIVFVCVGFVYLILPMNSILHFLHEQKFRQQQKCYQDVKDTFLKTYQTLNPLMSFKVEKVFASLKKRVSKQISFKRLDSQQQLQDKNISQFGLKVKSSNRLMGNYSNLDILLKTANKYSSIEQKQEDMVNRLQSRSQQVTKLQLTNQ